MGSFQRKGMFFQDFIFFWVDIRSLKCPLHIASYALRIEVSVIELYMLGSEFSISHTFRRRRYISIARTGNLILYPLGPFSRKRSHIHVHIINYQNACSFGLQYND